MITYPCDSDGYQNELLCTNLQTEYTNKWSSWCFGPLQCRLVDCRNLIFFIEMICWAPWFSQVQSTGLLSVFLEHNLMYLLWYFFLICLVSYSWLMRTLSYSKLVEKKLIKDKTELNHNIQWCPLINLLQSFIHNYDNTIRQYHKQRLTRTSQCFRKTKIQSGGARFVLFWQSKQNDTISEHDERWK